MNANNEINLRETPLKIVIQYQIKTKVIFFKFVGYSFVGYIRCNQTHARKILKNNGHCQLDIITFYTKGI